MSESGSDIYFDGLFLEELPVTPATPCSYFPDRQSRMRYAFSDDHIPGELLDILLARGFRRSGDLWYRPCCDDCQECQPYRIPVSRFKPGRNMKRVLRKNLDISVTIGQPELTGEKQQLYLDYQLHQHADSIKDTVNPEPELLEILQHQMYTNPSSTVELSMRLNGQLMGLGIMDIGKVATSLVYFAFSPAIAQRSPGTFNILKSIQWAEENGFKYTYLGYLLSSHPKMAYKSRFTPAEIRRPDGSWAVFQD